VVTLTETGTHSSIDARVGGYSGGEPELAVAMTPSAAGMLVIMDRGFPGVALWKAYTQARAHLLIRARSSVARRPVQVLDDGTYLARMNLAGQKGAHPGGVVVRVIEYRVDGGEVIRLLTDLLDPVAFPAAELAALYHERWEGEGSYRQVKTFQRGPQEILRSGDPELVRQETWAHLAVHHCLTRIIMRLASEERIDPDRLSFVKVLKHVRRSVIRQSAPTPVQIKQVMAMLAAKVRRKLDNGIRRLREADRSLKRPASKYSFRKAGQPRRPTRRVAAKVLTLHPAILQLVKQRHWPGTSKWNKIEHRLFSQITLAWRGRPLTSHDVIINTISAVTTATGLAVTAVLDRNPYPKGTKISDQQMRDIEDRALIRHAFHGERNYALRPAPAPPPGTPAPPARPGPDPATLADLTALAGLTPQDLGDLAAAITIAWHAQLEAQLYQARGGPRRHASGAARKLDLPAHILLTILHDRHGAPARTLAALTGLDQHTIRTAITRTRPLLAAGHPHALTPAAAGPSPALRQYAARAGLTIRRRPGKGTNPHAEHSKTPGTPQTHLILE